MSNILFSAFAFIITISFLVFIHEYGHFWMARRFGVRIEKFSIGFGKPIIKWHGKRDNTQYSIAWIPLGGYVKMYGETPNELGEQTAVDLSSDAADLDSAVGSFSALPPFKRLLIAFAGPAVNLIFAVLALWALFMIGVPDLKAIVGSVNNPELTRAGIGKGDTIVSVNHHEVDSMTDTMITLIDALGSRAVPLVAVDKNGMQKTATLDLSTYKAGSEMAVEKLAGFNWAIDEVTHNLPAIIETVSQQTPAEKAGFMAGDKVIRASDTPINNWQDFVGIVVASPEKPLDITVERAGSIKVLNLIPSKHPKDATKGYAGVSPKIDRQRFEQFRTTKRYGVLSALPKAISSNILQGELMLKTLKRLVVGKASIENLGGPLSIADYSGKTLSTGYVTYFNFLASISLVLAVMNLLPIPVLDGGHILLCFVEMVRGKPLSDRALDILMRLGGSLLITFMLLVLSVDVWRYLFK